MINDSRGTRPCGTCKQLLPAEAFALRSRATGRRQSKCRECVKAYNRDYHEKNREHLHAQIHERNRGHQQVLTRLALQARAIASCGSCGVSGEERLELHPPAHLTGGRRLSEVIRNGWSTERFTQLLQATLDSPDGVRCHSCARRTTPAVAVGQAVA